MKTKVATGDPLPRHPWIFVVFIGVVAFGCSVIGTDDSVAIATIIMVVAFVLFFARHMAFALVALNSAGRDLELPILGNNYRPTVSVIVACKNEGSVVDTLARRLLGLDYPTELLQLFIVDDGSTDDTGERLDRWAAREATLNVIHRLPGAGGGKSGALNEALEFAVGEVIVVFDADHEPHRDVLLRLSRHFQDPNVSAVQGRCSISNPGETPLTELVAIDYLAGYLVNEYGRQAVYRLPAYGGANCAVRRSSLMALGGWNPNTVTEDTDLTMQLILSGQRVRYDVTAVDEEEGVVTLTRFWRQRYRWARGHQQVWRDYRGQIWRSRHLSFLDKVETTMFLLVFHLPVISFFGMILMVLWLAGVITPQGQIDAYLLWTLLFLGPLLELGGGILIGKAPRRWVWSLVLFLPLFFVSIMLCTKAWVDGMLGRPYTWVKTARSQDHVKVSPP
jgi:cellulose synthase/poly-beta-1,6-N-acetylglucosamine synthase-like glycosyltransferase